MIAALAVALALVPAHPLGNFSVNQLVELELSRDTVKAVAILDLAELPTLQNRTEPRPACEAFARDLDVTVRGKPVTWQLTDVSFEQQPGAAGLKTSRLSCQLVAPAALDGAAEVTVVNRHLPDRVGWHELTANGLGVTGLPSQSSTNGLRTYPDDKLASPLDVRSAHLTLGSADTTAAAGSITSSTPSWLAGAEKWLQEKVSGTELTPLVGLLAVLLAMLLGAAHAALPGHGKTVMAVYLAGRQGRRRDAIAVGATVTATHTGGVLLLGLLLTSTTWLAGETVLGWLGIISGTVIAIVGLTMLRTSLTHRPHPHSHDHLPATAHHHHHDRTPDLAHSDDHGPAEHSHHAGHGHHGHLLGHAHGGGAEHSHWHGRGEHRRGLAALGIAGGLVPSPSALIVLLGAIALGRTGFGVLLVLAYGLGMAGSLTLAGLTLLTLRDRFSWLARLLTRVPNATGSLVLIVGAALAARAALTL